MLAIEYARNERQRKSCYRDLLKVARNTLGYSRRAISWIDVHGIELELLAIAGQLRHYCDLTEKAIVDGWLHTGDLGAAHRHHYQGSS